MEIKEHNIKEMERIIPDLAKFLKEKCNDFWTAALILQIVVDKKDELKKKLYEDK